jgi:hypothetical protein
VRRPSLCRVLLSSSFVLPSSYVVLAFTRNSFGEP